MTTLHFEPIAVAVLAFILALTAVAYGFSRTYERFVWLPRAILILLFAGSCAWNLSIPYLAVWSSTLGGFPQEQKLLEALLQYVPAWGFGTLAVLFLYAEFLGAIALWRLEIAKGPNDPTRVA